MLQPKWATRIRDHLTEELTYLHRTKQSAIGCIHSKNLLIKDLSHVWTWIPKRFRALRREKRGINRSWQPQSQQTKQRWSTLSLQIRGNETTKIRKRKINRNFRFAQEYSIVLQETEGILTSFWNCCEETVSGQLVSPDEDTTAWAVQVAID